MPLVSGKSKAALSKNIEIERNAGKPEKQAIAIAFSKRRSSKDKESEHEKAISKRIAHEKRKNPKLSNEQAAAIAYSELGEDDELDYEGDYEDYPDTMSRKGKNYRPASEPDQGEGEGIDTQDRLSMNSKREYDLNGWYEIQDNPLTKVGVFDYLGSQIGDNFISDRVYKVYRPADELSDQDCIDSFKLLPFIDEHAMLGAEAEGLTPAEKKGIHGVIGENIFFDGKYLRGNLKVFSEKLAGSIRRGKKELSIGYKCLYDETQGEYDSIKYDAIQRKIRGNHVALVEEGRSGPDIAVQDHFKITLDGRDLVMAKKGDMKKPEDAEPKEFVKKAHVSEDEEEMEDSGDNPRSNKSEGMKGEDKEKDDAEDKEMEDGESEDGEKSEKEDETEDAEMEGEPERGQGKRMKDRKRKSKDSEMRAKDRKSMDAAIAMDERISSLVEDVADLKRENKLLRANGEKVLFARISQRDTLAKKLAPHIGTFDHSLMTLEDTQKYGVSKLKEKYGIACDKGQEEAFLNGYLAAAGSRPAFSTVTQDSAPQSKQVLSYIKGDK